jgi:chromosome segregation ATPase
MEKILNLILGKLDSLDKKVDNMDQRLTVLEHQVDTLGSEQKRQGDLLHQLINTVAATNVKLNETNEKMTVIETKVDSVIEDVKSIKNTMATKHDLEYYDQMISEHSRQIYKLKNH